MKLRQELQAIFPEAPEDDILKVVDNLLSYRYMNPAIVAPDAFDVVDVGMDNQLSTDQVGVGVEWIVYSTILSDILIVTYCSVKPGQHFIIFTCPTDTKPARVYCQSFALFLAWKADGGSISNFP